MKIAIHQMCSGIDPQKNVDNMVRAISTSAKTGAHFYFAPEMSVMLDRDRGRAPHKISVENDSQVLKILQAAAADAGIWVHLGSMPVRLDPDSLFFANRTIVIDDKGTVRARYDKIHLFDVELSTGESWRESSVYKAGEFPVMLETPLGAVGLSICYDIRFPDLFSALAKAGASVLAVPAAFTVPTGKAHWHILLRARAIEAEAFVIAAAQSGHHEDGRSTYGHSLVIDPWGDVLLDMGEGEGLGFADLDLARIAEVRSQIPVHSNRRGIPSEVKRY